MKSKCLVLLCSVLSFTAFSQNVISGKISLPKSKLGFIKKGTAYQSDDIKSSEKLRIDEDNRTENNIYISFHPQSFKPVLQASENVQMTQRAKTFYPNVVAITKGSTVYFVNEDEHYHNVYSLSPKARFNIGRRPTGNVYGQKINKSGIIKLGCDIHPEMGAVIISLDTPYFTKADAEGNYNMKDLPNGVYEIQIYHPSIQKYKETIDLTKGVAIEKNISLKPKV